MSFAIDVNILVYATSEGEPRQQAAKAFIESCARGPEVFYLAWLTVMSYVRLVTHPKILQAPLSTQDANRNIEMLLRLPNCRTLSEQEGFWSDYLECTKDFSIRSDDVPDAYLATVLKQNGITRIYTADRGFRRFDFLKVIDPLR